MSERVRILIVDDSNSVRTATRRILELLDYEIVGEAEDGIRGVTMTKKLRPALVLMDVEMPQLDGIEAARKIQQVCPTPVILLTAHESPDLIRQARDAGVGAYLVKPLNADEFSRIAPIAMARFEEWMELRRLNAELRQRNAQLQKAIETIKTLSGLLSVCAWCGQKIQDEAGQWVNLQAYIEAHSDAEFTHGICPECLARMRNGRRRA